MVKRLRGCLGVSIFCPVIQLHGLTRPTPHTTSCDFVPTNSCLTCCLVRVAYRQPLIYNAEVARELLKQVYIAERLQPPSSFAAITDAYSILWGRAKNPQYWRDLLTTGEWARVAVYAVEAYTVFKVSSSFSFSIILPFFLSFWFHDADSVRKQVGEIIGRRHLIGYKLH